LQFSIRNHVLGTLLYITFTIFVVCVIYKLKTECFASVSW